MTIVLFLGIALAFALGAIIGFLTHEYLFRRERDRMANDWLDIAHSHETLGRRLKLDDTRLGLNTGIEFAVDLMAETLDEIKTHVKSRE